MTRLFPTETASGCGIVGGRFVVGPYLEGDGAAGAAIYPGSNRFAQPFTGPGGSGTSWTYFDCSIILPGCTIRVSNEDPRPYVPPGQQRMSWKFETPTVAPLKVLDQTIRVAASDSITVSDDGRWVVMVAIDGSGVLRYDTATGAFRRVSTWQSSGGARVAVSPSGRYVAVGAGGIGIDNLRVYDTDGCVDIDQDHPSPAACPSASIQQLLGVPELTSLGRHLKVKFIGERVISFQALSSALPGGSATEYKTFELKSLQDAPPPLSGNSLAVLGDSFTSGEGDAGHYREHTDEKRAVSNLPGADLVRVNMCHQSTRAWPALTAFATGVADARFTNASCSSARTHDIQNRTQWPDGEPAPFPGSEPQLLGLIRAGPVDRVLVQIGGNDANFASMIKACVLDDCSQPARLREYALAIQKTFSRVRSTLQQISEVQPSAEVALVGYPAIVETGGTGHCGSNVHMSDAERVAASRIATYLDQVQRATAASAGVRYISLLDAIETHQLCDASPWVNGLLAGDSAGPFGLGPIAAESYHPDHRAHVAFSQSIVNALETDPCAETLCATPTSAPALPSWVPPASGQDPASWVPDMARQCSTGATLCTLNATPGGLRPGSSVTGSYHSTPVAISPVTVDIDGNATVTTPIPIGLEPGWHQLELNAVAQDGTPLHAWVPFVVPGAEGDQDGDGQPDTIDLCPTIPGGASDAQDSDGDGIGDPCDGIGDSTPPVLTLPADRVVEAEGSSGAVVSFVAASASDDVDGLVSVTCSQASGDTFAIGVTTVDCSASDVAGNTSSGSFNVTVLDTTAPALALPTDRVAEADGSSGAVVSFAPASASDVVDGSVPVTCSQASGDTFAIGVTTVDCSASDAAGNTSSGSFNVTVSDTSPPALTLPGDISVEATGPTGAQVTFDEPAAVDLVDGTLTPDCSSRSGDTFGVGVTYVACSASDGSGNRASGSFRIEVREPALVGIEIEPSSALLVLDDSRQFSAVGVYSNGTTRNVTSDVAWSSSSPTVATAGIDGVIHGLTVGSTQISATSGTVVATASVQVKADSRVVLVSSAEPAVFGQVGQVTATVSTVAPGAGTPTGQVTFTVDGTPRTPVTVSGGRALLKLSALSVGEHVITASYSGDAGRAGSGSDPLTQTVN